MCFVRAPRDLASPATREGKRKRRSASAAPAERAPSSLPEPRARSPPSRLPRGPRPPHTEPPAPRRPRGRLCCRCCSRRRPPPPRAWKEARSREAGAAEARPRTTCSGCVTRRGHGRARRGGKRPGPARLWRPGTGLGARPARKLSRAAAPPPTRAGPAAELAARRPLPRDSALLHRRLPHGGKSRRRGWAGPAGVREVREGGLTPRRRRAEGKGRESERYSEACRRLLHSASGLSSSANQDCYLRHPL